MGPRGVSFFGDVENTGGGVGNAATWVRPCNLSLLNLFIASFPTFPKIPIFETESKILSFLSMITFTHARMSVGVNMCIHK